MSRFHLDWTEWLTLTGQGADDVYDRLEELERKLLDHHPKHLDEAWRLLDVVLAQSDPRCDGRDYAAVRRVRGLIVAAMELDSLSEQETIMDER